ARIITTRGAVSVGLPGAGPGDETVPHARVEIQQRDLVLGAVAVEQAHQQGIGGGSLHGEVRPAVTHGRAERERAARQRWRALCRSGRRRAGRGRGAAGCSGRRGTWWCHGWASRAMLRTTSPTEATAPWRRRITSAISPVHPVWCEAPSPAPLSPWKYSLNSRLSFQAGSCCSRSTHPKQGRRPSGPTVNSEMSRSCRSAEITSRGTLCPEPAGYSMVSSSPKNR